MTVRVADAKKSPQIVVKDKFGNILKVINTCDVQVGFKGNESTFTLTGGFDITSQIVTFDSQNTSYNVQKKDIVLCASSTAVKPTFVLPGNPDKGEVHIVKDSAGTANSFNITIFSESGALIDDATTHTISSAFGATILIWNGVQWITIEGGSGSSTVVTIGGIWSTPAAAVYEQKRLVYAGASLLCLAMGFNGGSNTYVQIYDATAEPSTNALPKISFPTFSNKTFSLELPRGFAMSSGIYIATSTTGDKYTANTSGQIFLDVEYSYIV